MRKIVKFPVQWDSLRKIPYLEFERNAGFVRTSEALEKFMADLPLTKEQFGAVRPQRV